MNGRHRLRLHKGGGRRRQIGHVLVAIGGKAGYISSLRFIEREAFMVPSTEAHSAPITDFASELDALVADAMSEWKIPGLAIAVVQNGAAALLKAYGLRDVEAQLRVTTDTHFMICSITKSFT